MDNPVDTTNTLNTLNTLNSTTATQGSQPSKVGGVGGAEPVKVSQQFLVHALRSGHSIEDIANILNVTTDALTELINTYGLRDLAARTQQLVSIDAKLNNLEEDIIDKLSQSLKQNLVPQTPMEYARMLGIVNAAKRKTAGASGPLETTGAPRLVNIQLPPQLKVEVTVNSLGQVTNVDGREIKTISADRLENHAAKVPLGLPDLLAKGTVQATTLFAKPEEADAVIVKEIQEVQDGQSSQTKLPATPDKSAAERIREQFAKLQASRTK